MIAVAANLGYSPLALNDFFNERLRSFYAIPPGISVHFRDINLGKLPTPQWRLTIANIDHETPWEAPWGSITSKDFTRVLWIILTEAEEKFHIEFPRELASI